MGTWRATRGHRKDAKRGEHLATLANDGRPLFRAEAGRAPGGDLAPDRIAALLKTRALGRSLCAYESVTSTSDVARADGLSGAPHGHLILAERQTAGRGRMGRAWLSPPGDNLAFSLVLRPALAVEEAPAITLASALACRNALSALNLEAAIKWPNDLLIDGRKVAGILSELSLDRGRLRHVVLGIGLNVNLDPATLEPPLCETATSLAKALGRRLDRAEVLASLLRHIEATLEVLVASGFAHLSAQYCACSATIGQRVRVLIEGGAIEGRAIGLGARGSLRLELDSGEVREILAGDVEQLRGAR